MKAQDDELTRPEGISLSIFLEAEKHRHLEDVQMIEGALSQLTRKFCFSEDEQEKIKERSRRYIKF
ncbi:MAG: hypothetical protein WC614_13445 [bacterium]